MSELCSVPRVSERFAQSNALDEDIARLKYVSGKREEALRRLGIRTVGDLLLHIPIDIWTSLAHGPSRWRPSVPCAPSLPRSIALFKSSLVRACR
ncbi:MAG: hypothetical protein ACLTYW_06075 [Collinsella sp.]